MLSRLPILGLLGLLLLPALAGAAEHSGPLDLPWWSALPFVLLLLAIAVLPLAAENFWHNDRNKALVAALLALPVVGLLYQVQQTTSQDTLTPLLHELGHYVSFILLLGSLYIVSGGIVLRGDIEGKPATNTAFLAAGAVLANLVGTTGASMLLVRPVLRINHQREHTRHLPIFFIFIVSNLGGLLTPLGDPPLFLGYLNGVDFLWTMRLWPEWLTANGLVLMIFYFWDVAAYRRETREAIQRDHTEIQPLRLVGLVNLPLLAGITVTVLVQGQLGDVTAGAFLMGLAVLSLRLTPRSLRAENGFSWRPIGEVAILFAGIFVTMVPALHLLATHGHELDVSQPWQYFWMTGSLSAVLDNAPTYLTFATLAAGSEDYGLLVRNEVGGLDGPLVLAAISCGAVFMGALTYIGNGPNFMVKAIADQAGFKTPSFLGYLAYSCAILLPVFAVITVVFFRPA